MIWLASFFTRPSLVDVRSNEYTEDGIGYQDTQSPVRRRLVFVNGADQVYQHDGENGADDEARFPVDKNEYGEIAGDDVDDERKPTLEEYGGGAQHYQFVDEKLPVTLGHGYPPWVIL